MGSGLAWGYASNALDQLLAQRRAEALAEADRQEKIRQFNVGAAERQRAHDLQAQIHQATLAQHAEQQQFGRARTLYEETPRGRELTAESGRLMGQFGFPTEAEQTLPSRQTAGGMPLVGAEEQPITETKPSLSQATGRLLATGGPREYLAQQAADERRRTGQEAFTRSAQQAKDLEAQRAADREQQIRLVAGLRPPKDTTAADLGRLDRSFQYNKTELEKMRTPIAEKQARLDRLEATLAQGTPQADALVAPELLTVMAGGQGSGLRMNEAEIARIVGGRSVWENLKASANRWALDPRTANSITSAQRQQIRDLAGAVRAKVDRANMILNDASGALVTAPDVTSHREILDRTHRALQVNESAGGADNAGPMSSRPEPRQRYDMNGQPLP